MTEAPDPPPSHSLVDSLFEVDWPWYANYDRCMWQYQDICDIGSRLGGTVKQGDRLSIVEGWVKDYHGRPPLSLGRTGKLEKLALGNQEGWKSPTLD